MPAQAKRTHKNTPDSNALTKQRAAIKRLTTDKELESIKVMMEEATKLRDCIDKGELKLTNTQTSSVKRLLKHISITYPQLEKKYKSLEQQIKTLLTMAAVNEELIKLVTKLDGELTMCKNTQKRFPNLCRTPIDPDSKRGLNANLLFSEVLLDK